jgi:hypothetical protein
MPRSRPPTKTPTPESEGENRSKRGYVRSQATHIGTEWGFEVLSDDRKVAIATIWTGDGPVHIGLNRVEATNLVQKLQLFLHDWPEDQGSSKASH